MKTWSLLRLLLVIGLLAGCAGLANIEWAKTNKIPILEVNAPDGEWKEFESFLYSFRADAGTIVIINVPGRHWDQVVRYYNVRPETIWYARRLDSDPQYWFLPIKIRCFFLEPSVIFRMGKYPCLNHEIGHMREYLEGVPYHSKYAR